MKLAFTLIGRTRTKSRSESRESYNGKYMDLEGSGQHALSLAIS